MLKRHYVYKLIDPRDNQTFYVGKGTGNRANDHTMAARNKRKTSNRFKDAKIAQMLLDNVQVRVLIVQEFNSATEAFAAELKLIQSLPNLTNNMQSDWVRRTSKRQYCYQPYRPQTIRPKEKYDRETRCRIALARSIVS